jgi:multidrug/hemolysin transport system permease protein
MTVITNLISRNLKLYFRDRTSVFFSLLGVLIIIGLYVLFLGNLIVKNLEGFVTVGARFTVDSWIMAGVLAVTTVTTTMGAYGAMIEDRSKKISRDFSSAPVKRSQLAAGYILSSFIIGMIMTVAALIIAEIYIVAYGGKILPLIPLLKILGLIMLSVLANSSFLFLVVSFFRTTNAFATASTILGTLIGFIAGIYVQIGILPVALQTIIKIFPISHVGLLMRQVMMEAPMSLAFAGAPADVVDSFKKTMGAVFYFGEKQISPIISIVIIAGAGILFYILAVIRISMKRKS